MFWGLGWTSYSTETRPDKVHDIVYFTFTLRLYYSWTLAGVISLVTQDLCSVAGSYNIAIEVAAFLDFIKAKAVDGEFCADNN